MFAFISFLALCCTLWFPRQDLSTHAFTAVCGSAFISDMSDMSPRYNHCHSGPFKLSVKGSQHQRVPKGVVHPHVGKQTTTCTAAAFVTVSSKPPGRFSLSLSFLPPSLVLFTLSLSVCYVISTNSCSRVSFCACAIVTFVTVFVCVCVCFFVFVCTLWGFL